VTKATAKNVTVAVEAKKRKGAGASKVVSKKQKTLTASVVAFAAASTDDAEEVVENVSGGSESVAARVGGERFVASLDLSGDDFVDMPFKEWVAALLLN
jgi:hypothetical protein